MEKKIKVLVIDDSIIFRRVISKYLEEDPELEVVETAKDSYDARDKVLQFKPDVLTLDIEMPGINGIEFLKALMSQCPIPTIVISAANDKCFEALSAGAVDFVDKPTSNTMNEFAIDLVSKIKEASVAKIDTKKSVAKLNRLVEQKTNTRKTTNITNNDEKIIAIGASMGGVEAVSKVLKALPLGLPGIVITQHMPPIFTKKYSERLDRECIIDVSEARHGEVVLPGHAYIAPGGLQMSILKKNNKFVIQVKEGEKVTGHCPSVDYLFESVARAAKEKSIAAILTGMGSDGAKGLLEIKKSGGYTIGQNKSSCVVYGMPMAAMNIGAVVKETSLDMIPNAILNQLKRDETQK